MFLIQNYRYIQFFTLELRYLVFNFRYKKQHSTKERPDTFNIIVLFCNSLLYKSITKILTIYMQSETRKTI